MAVSDNRRSRVFPDPRTNRALSRSTHCVRYPGFFALLPASGCTCRVSIFCRRRTRKHTHTHTQSFPQVEPAAAGQWWHVALAKDATATQQNQTSQTKQTNQTNQTNQKNKQTKKKQKPNKPNFSELWFQTVCFFWFLVFGVCLRFWGFLVFVGFQVQLPIRSSSCCCF
jgi:hypothetical protein